jgi:hypothetical protein
MRPRLAPPVIAPGGPVLVVRGCITTVACRREPRERHAPMRPHVARPVVRRFVCRRPRRQRTWAPRPMVRPSFWSGHRFALQLQHAPPSSGNAYPYHKSLTGVTHAPQLIRAARRTW